LNKLAGHLVPDRVFVLFVFGNNILEESLLKNQHSAIADLEHKDTKAQRPQRKPASKADLDAGFLCGLCALVSLCSRSAIGEC
jgi:hypothetical protein